MAVKVFDKQGMSTDELKAANKERMYLSILKHDHVMHLIDNHEDESHLYLVMDLMIDDFRNVYKKLKCPMKEEYAKRIFYQMLQAVNYSHKCSVIHRDVKMANFLVDFDDDTGRVKVKLSDFGLATTYA